jgi:hypothetical protein
VQTEGAYVHPLVRIAAAVVLIFTAVLLVVSSCSMLMPRAHAEAACSIIGDSIAVSLSVLMPECTSNARIGIGSQAVTWRVQPAGTVIVSAGSNDPFNKHLRENLEAIRGLAILVGAKKIIWVKPANEAAATVMAVAVTHDDPMVTFAPGRDGVHPASDTDLAAKVRKVMQ